MGDEGFGDKIERRKHVEDRGHNDQFEAPGYTGIHHQPPGQPEVFRQACEDGEESRAQLVLSPDDHQLSAFLRQKEGLRPGHPPALAVVFHPDVGGFGCVDEVIGEPEGGTAAVYRLLNDAIIAD